MTPHDNDLPNRNTLHPDKPAPSAPDPNTPPKANEEEGPELPPLNYAFVVDDDEAICDALKWQLRTRGIECVTWTKAEDFLAEWHPEWCGCIVLDIRLSGMSGLACFDVLLEQQCQLPIIFITGHGDIPMAVDALKKGAFDFIEKPFNHNELANRIEAAFHASDQRQLAIAHRESIKARIASLTSREREVMDMILSGHLNKTIGLQLVISMRTVEAHRSRVFRKMKVHSAVELAQLMNVLKE